MLLHTIIKVSAFCLIAIPSTAQNDLDTISYTGTLGPMLYETIELYPDKSFKWTSEYDLSWSEYGTYTIEEDELKLEYYTKSPNTNPRTSNTQIPDKIEIFEIEGNLIYRLNRKGKKIKRIKDRSFKIGLSWIFGHKYRIQKG